jgi:hypothetical protein
MDARLFQTETARVRSWHEGVTGPSKSKTDLAENVSSCKP